MYDLNNYNKYRTSIMGFSIIIIILFHYNGLGITFVDYFTSIGWCGVDFFIFLSAIGLTFSLNKDSSTPRFYKRRIIRIIPTWWLLITAFWMIGVIFDEPRPNSILDIILYYTGLGWWVNGYFENFRNVCYEWYVPTILLFYVTTPYLNRLQTKSLNYLLIAAVLMVLLFPIFHIGDSIYWSYQRIPIFILGILYARKMIRQLTSSSVVKIRINICFITGLILFILSRIIQFDNIIFTLSIQRIAVLLSTPFVLLLISKGVEYTNTKKIFSLFGVLSLELYLLHIYNKPLILFEHIIPNHSISVVCACFLCTICAWLIQAFVNKIYKRTKYFFNKNNNMC